METEAAIAALAGRDLDEFDNEALVVAVDEILGDMQAEVEDSDDDGELYAQLQDALANIDYELGRRA